MPKWTITKTVLGTVTALALGACFDGSTGPDNQVIAVVDGQEITIHQLEFELSQTAPVHGETDAQRRRRAAEQLVNRHILATQAREAKLHRSPSVNLALQRARNEILAQAYLNHIAATDPPPTAEQISRYYQEHPELFAQRRVYHFEELHVDRNALSDSQQAHLQTLASPQDIKQWLTSQNIAYQAQESVKAAEQLPFFYLDRFKNLNARDTTILANDRETVIVNMLQIAERPIDELKATPLIRRFLANRRRRETLAQQLSFLRENAQVEWLGDVMNDHVNNQKAENQP